jgi:amino-acid N-acetyltransferase
MDDALTLRPATDTDGAYVDELLSDNDLPTADLSGALDSLYLIEVDDRRVGVAGLERHGDLALLRSVAVEASERGNGYGVRACQTLLDRAADAGVSTVYLLTTTAAGFFDRLGFQRVDRAAVPDPIRATREFSELCPSTAVVMRRDPAARTAGTPAGESA